MAIISRINKNSGLVVGVVVLALALFLVGDAFFGQNSLFSSNKQDVGEISGYDVSLAEYQNALQRSEYEHQIRTGKSVTENDKNYIQDQAWNDLIYNYAYKGQFDELGLQVTTEEWIDMAQGENIHPMVKSLFGNSEDFNKSLVVEFLSSFDQVSPEYQALWYYVERTLPVVRYKEKYANLFKKTVYVTQHEAKREYESQQAKASGSYVYVPFYSVADSVVTVTDADLKDYIKRNEHKYKVEEGRSVDYVVFDVKPTSEDSLIFKNELAEIAADFLATTEDSLFVFNNSDNPAEPSFKNIGQLPESLRNNIQALEIGKVYGPFSENGKLSLIKIVDEKNDSLFSAKASHILFKPATESKEDKAAAQKQAKEVLDQIKKGADFKEMAKIHGTDGTASRGGDLGWFTEGQMVKTFNDAVFKANSIGLLPTLVETDFGYHIIDIANTKTKKSYKLAVVEREIGFTESSKEAVYQLASDFARDVKDTASFKKLAESNPNVTLYSAENFKKIDRNINTLSNAREVIRWAFNDASLNKVSPVFQLENQFVVAVLTGKRDAGLANVNDVRDEVTAKVKDEKKAEYIISKLNGINAPGLQDLATQYGKEAVFGKAENVTLNSNTIQGVGYDPKSTGVLFGLKEGGKSKAFKGENGVVVLELKSIAPAAEIADYAEYATQIKQRRSGRQDYSADEAIKKKADIEDNRYKYF